MWLKLRQVALVAEELEPVLEDLAAVLGLEVAYRDPGVARFGLENAVLPIGTQFLEVVAPTRPDTAAGRHLERRRGPGGYMVIAHTDEHDARRAKVAELGIRTVLEFDEEGYRCMQLHPSDTGGIFLEIDRQDGGDDPNGPWMPAGPSWQGAVRTGVVDGIRAVELQANDADAVAARWSEITDLPVERDAGGRPALSFDGDAIRFLPDSDGRGNGVAGIELSTTDPDRARAAAADRGLAGDDGVITLCGTRILLGPAR
jgi:hypothetical protein